MAERPTSKNTKAEILDMYDELLKERKQLETSVDQLRKEKQAAPKARDMGVAKAAAAPSTLDGVMNTLTVLRPGFGDAVSELSAKLIAEASKLAELRGAVEQETQQLEALHELQVADETLDQLMQEYLEKSSAFEAEAQQQEVAFEQEITEKKKVWQKEQGEHAVFLKERNDTAKKVEQREAAEYKYDLELQRKLDTDQYEQQQAQLQKALEDFETSKKKAWAERENRIVTQEQEFAELQTKVEKWPKELETAVKKAREEATAIAQRQTKVKADLRAKEAEGERRVYELKIQSLDEIIQQQRQQIASLTTQLEAAVKQVQDLAVRAIDGASSAGSLQAVREIALEQAKNIQKKL